MSERDVISVGDYDNQKRLTETLKTFIEGKGDVHNPLFGLNDDTMSKLQTLFTGFSTGPGQITTNALLTSMLAVLEAQNALAALVAPATSHWALTPDDDEDLSTLMLREVYVGIGGDVAIRANGVTVVYTVPDGTTLPVRAQRVMQTDTTASAIVGWA